MKPAIALLIAALSLAAAGCGSPAASLYPLYKTDEPHPVEPGIEGKWLPEDAESAEAKDWEVTGVADGCYEVKAQRPPAEKGKTPSIDLYRICLVRLQDKLFFDSELVNRQIGAETVSANDLGDSVVRGYIIARLWLQKDMVRVGRLDSEWIKKNTPE